MTRVYLRVEVNIKEINMKDEFIEIENKINELLNKESPLTDEEVKLLFKLNKKAGNLINKSELPSNEENIDKPE